MGVRLVKQTKRFQLRFDPAAGGRLRPGGEVKFLQNLVQAIARPRARRQRENARRRGARRRRCLRSGSRFGGGFVVIRLIRRVGVG